MTPTPMTIKAGGVQNWQGHGRYFLCTATTGAFRVRTSTGDEYDFSEINSGFSESDPKGFGYLTFYNDGVADVTITFYVSNSPIKVPDVAVSSSVPVTAVVSFAVANEGDNQAQITCATGAAQSFTGGSPAKYRRAILIAQQSLDRTANAGNVYIGATIVKQPLKLAPGEVWVLEADTSCQRDLANLFISADNAGDGISVIYTL